MDYPVPHATTTAANAARVGAVERWRRSTRESRALAEKARADAAEAREREAVARADRFSGYLGASIVDAIPAAVANAYANAIRVILEPDARGHVPSYARVLADRIAQLAKKPQWVAVIYGKLVLVLYEENQAYG
jgi:hypothetical protein